MLTFNSAILRYLFYSIIGLVVGGILGALFGLMLLGGQLNQTKKSQRGAVSDIMFIPMLALGGVVGMVLGVKVAASAAEEEEDNRIKQEIGLDKIETNYYKAGRYWQGESNWTHLISSGKYLLKTYRSSVGSIVSTLNNELLITHSGTSANKDYIPQVHEEILKKVVKSYVEDYKNAKK